MHDQCSNVAGVEAVTVPGVGTVCEHEQLQTRYGTPHTVAGESIATDTNKCALKPLRRTDYYPIEFTDDQWAQLETAFPTGVCDWSQPGPEQRGTVPWRTYQQGANGAVVFGGKPLGPAAAGSGDGWTSDSFDSWRQAAAGGLVAGTKSGARARARARAHARAVRAERAKYLRAARRR